MFYVLRNTQIKIKIIGSPEEDYWGKKYELDIYRIV